MAAVNLNRRMVLEAPNQVPDGAGGFTETWAELGSLWVELRARGGRETSGEETSLSQTGFKILVRAAPYGAPSRPSPGQRFRDGTRNFRIRSVAEFDQRGRYLSCFSDEEVVT
ncbi:head-tail adaptor protein [uncultured Roseovarius sp.]|uniref:head-tail adaptor protein n=1 Tax=uncultured Roseovarius sp. TaxID=293344 RepID=UPI00261B10D5|nr:head-tail adaptor protein [uncultured Roseovarius sp.]